MDDMFIQSNLYSRHVILPLEIARWLPHHGLMTEEECRALGVSQSVGWQHYMVHGKDSIESIHMY